MSSSFDDTARCARPLNRSRRVRSRGLSLLERDLEPAEDALHGTVVGLQPAFEVQTLSPVDFLVQLQDLLLQRIPQQLRFFAIEFDLHGKRSRCVMLL